MWFLIKSWHVERFQSRIGLPKAYCGKWGYMDSKTAAELPADEKSCESCLRILKREEENNKSV